MNHSADLVLESGQDIWISASPTFCTLPFLFQGKWSTIPLPAGLDAFAHPINPVGPAGFIRWEKLEGQPKVGDDYKVVCLVFLAFHLIIFAYGCYLNTPGTGWRKARLFLRHLLVGVLVPLGVGLGLASAACKGGLFRRILDSFSLWYTSCIVILIPFIYILLRNSGLQNNRTGRPTWRWATSPLGYWRNSGL